ncbi:mucin-4-like isoform X4 [Ptychodera flava]|uniref:mucin-4-like isoform X4 n=1 Tax=Ptychodera flava TaxID=63121 RepID=UPI003969CD5D
MPKDSHSTSRLNYSRHDTSSADKEEKARKTEYLEALTNAYMKNGILPQGEKEIPTFRYTAGQRGMSSAPMNGMDGLCPHHEKTFAAQYVANHLSDLQFTDDQYEWGHSSKNLDDAQGSSRSRPTTRQHVVALSAVQQRQQDLLQLQHQMARSQQSRPSTGRGSPIKTHPSPFDEQLDDRRQTDYTDFVKRGYSAKARSSHPNSRCPSATQISYPQPQPSKQQQPQHYQQQQHRRQDHHQDREDGLKVSTSQQTTGRTGSVSNHRTTSTSNVSASKKSGRTSRTGNHSVDSEIMTNEVERLVRHSRYSASTSDMSDTDPEALHKHAPQPSVPMTATSSKAYVPMSTGETGTQTGKQHLHISPREARVSSHTQSGHKTDLSISTKQILKDGHQHKQDTDRSSREHTSHTVSPHTASANSNNSNANGTGRELTVTKLSSADSHKHLSKRHCSPTELVQPVYPIEKNMGSSHHFRRAENFTQQQSEQHGSPDHWNVNKSRPRRSLSGGHLTSEGSPLDREDLDIMEEEEARAVSGHVPSYRSQARTPLVSAEPGRGHDPTISLTLERGYSYYDRFGNNRKQNRPPLLRYHPKRL